MAKTNTADTTTPAPAKAVAAAPSAKSTRVLTAPEFTAGQRDSESYSPEELQSVFGDGSQPKGAPPPVKAKDDEEKPKAKVETKAKEEEKEPVIEDDDAPKLPEEADELKAKDEDEDEDLPKGELEKLRFEKRELKRELKAFKEATAAEVAELKAAKSTESVAVPEASGFFQGAKAPKDVDACVKNLKGWIAFFDDAEEGDEDPISKEPLEKKTIKARLRYFRDELERAPDIKKSFAELETRRETANAKAKKLFPWASDPESKHQSTLLDLAKAHPEVAKAPDSSYALGLMTIGKLWESGKYKLVATTPAKAKAEDEPVKAAKAPPQQREKPAPKAEKARDDEDEDDYAKMRRGDTAAADRAALRVFGG